jgi:hypothetical protein
MDQKNTIVKCKAHPNCLFNHNGVCDNYVISIGENGKCDCYVETENEKKRDAMQDIWIVKMKLFERDIKEIERKKNEI